MQNFLQPLHPRPPSGSRTHPQARVPYQFKERFDTYLESGEIDAAMECFKIHWKKFSNETILSALKFCVKLEIGNPNSSKFLVSSEFTLLILETAYCKLKDHTEIILNVFENAILSDEVSIASLEIMLKIVQLYSNAFSDQNHLLQSAFSKAMMVLALLQERVTQNAERYFYIAKELALEILKKHPKSMDHVLLSDRDQRVITKSFLTLLSHSHKHDDHLEYFLLSQHIFQPSDPQIMQNVFEKALRNKKYIALKIMEMYSPMIDPKYILDLFKKSIDSAFLKRKLLAQIIENYPARTIGHDLICSFFKRISSAEYLEDPTLIEFLFSNPDFADQIESQMICDVYENTQSEKTAMAIYFYAHCSGSWRQLELPLNKHGIQLEIADLDMDHAAQEIHKYSAGLDKLCLFQIKTMLFQYSIKRKKFSIEDLKEKIGEVFEKNPEDQQNSLKSLDKLMSGGDENSFAERFEVVLPIIATFLDSDSINWIEKSTAQERWELWLKQSFVESAQAYEGLDSTSCAAGIYERTVSGLRTLHHMVDAIFLPSNQMRHYFPLSDDGFDPKIELLIKRDVLEFIVRRLLVFYRTGRNRKPEIITTWNHFKSICTDILMGHIELDFRKRIVSDYSDLISDDLMQILNENISVKIKEVRRKLNFFIDNLESIDLAHGADPMHPILFTCLVSRIYCHIEKRKNPLTLQTAIDEEIRSTLEAIEKNKLNKKMFDFFQQEFHDRDQLEIKERHERYDIIDYKDQILSEE